MTGDAGGGRQHLEQLRAKVLTLGLPLVSEDQIRRLQVAEVAVRQRNHAVRSTHLQQTFFRTDGRFPWDKEKFQSADLELRNLDLRRRRATKKIPADVPQSARG